MKAMAEYILANKEKIRMYLTLHSYSQMWLVPWGYTYSKPSDYSELVSAAKKAIGENFGGTTTTRVNISSM
uniref:carboxypeptidase B-like n=1 Tax=Osmia lignaria TaxID=473952 RepID=UPI001479616B|nr:carboxypeptidase B-like [Osmia lignaria]